MTSLNYASEPTAAIGNPVPAILAGAETGSREADKTRRYAGCIMASKRAQWDIDDDVIRGRTFDPNHKFLPDGLTRLDRLDFLDAGEKRFLGQVQGRTYANIFGLVERFIAAKVVELTNGYIFGNQTAMQALVRFTEEEIKHQELFRRIDALAARAMPAGYVFGPEPNAVANAVLGKGTWAVLALTLHIELFTQSHFVESIAPDESLSPLYRDVFKFHWREEAQHAVLDELEWRNHDATVTPAQRDHGVDELIELVGAVDGIIRSQAEADTAYFMANCGRDLGGDAQAELGAAVLAAYRWQYILSGAAHPHFQKVLTSLVTPNQMTRIQGALSTLN